MNSDRTVITFDLPDERRIEVPRLVPLLRRDDELEIDDEHHVVRSATLVVDSTTNDVTLYLRLRGSHPGSPTANDSPEDLYREGQP